MKFEVGSALVYKNRSIGIVGLMAVIDNVYYEIFGLANSQKTEVLFDFKMLEFQQNYVFQFEIIFENKSSIIMLFNPMESGVITFLEDVKKTNQIIINLLNFDNGENIPFSLTNSYTDDWLSRNIRLSKSLKANPLFFGMCYEMVKTNSNPIELYFIQNKNLLHLTFE